MPPKKQYQQKLTTEQIAQVHSLVMNKVSYSKICKALGIKSKSVITNLVQKNQWIAEREQIEKEATEKFNKDKVEDLAHKKLEYKNDNLRVTDLSKNIGRQILETLKFKIDSIKEQFKDNPEKMHKELLREFNPDFMQMYKDAGTRTESVAKTQDEMLFSTKKIAVEGSVTLSIEEAFSKVAEATKSELEEIVLNGKSPNKSLE